MAVNYVALSWCLILFVGMTLLPYAGYRLAARIKSAKGEVAQSSGSVDVTTAVFALLGLLMAFFFSGSFSRFDDRRQILVDEANSIGTAYSRVDLVNPVMQDLVREKFHEYAVSRARLFSLLDDREVALQELERSAQLQTDIWSLIFLATEDPEYIWTRLLIIPALNEMIDISARRTVAIQTHPPLLISVVLSVVALTAAALIGYTAGINGKDRPGAAHVLVYSTVVTMVLYAISDVEFPRYGFVTLERVNQILVDLADSMAG